MIDLSKPPYNPPKIQDNTSNQEITKQGFHKSPVGDPCFDFFGDGKEKEVSAIFDSISKLNQTESRRLTMATKANTEIEEIKTVTGLLAWMFDPANGKVGNKHKVIDRKTKKPVTVTSTGFHAVYSGFNDLLRDIGVDLSTLEKTKAFWSEAVARKMCNITPTKGGVMVRPYKEVSSNKGKALLEEITNSKK